MRNKNIQILRRITLILTIANMVDKSFSNFLPVLFFILNN
ncbi:hypothetical protein SeKA_A4162 [Salmonella enterica subsp. enterica serovar Kentucky str. CVM29188]|nr:hypothetical protein SeKA_A4162 [Salmonella enterica subsp. enterica serovar Kentucky str. CVM29188]EDZ19663.1 hypothetical protein SeKB_A4695 [Salmonella enterica subsp. enterica serovar Kentucky str. CDC 191]